VLLAWRSARTCHDESLFRNRQLCGACLACRPLSKLPGRQGP
jgi:hypothetical protein